MIRLDNLKGHNEMCGGYSYSGYATFEGRTVKEVLEEIREYAKNTGNDIGEGFGKKGKDMGACWGIRINDIPYVGGWVGWKNEYDHSLDDAIVKEVHVHGGWYCFYDFDIIAEEDSRAKKKPEEQENEHIMRLLSLE
jgi:hypothetical protein